jgi:hypothetical protein
MLPLVARLSFRTLFPQGEKLLLAAFAIPVVGGICSSTNGLAQNALPALSTTLTAAQIVDRMQIENRARAESLGHYQSVRHYSVDYKGFGTTIAADMTVEADYDAVSGKSFRIVSQSGSKMLIDKVLKRALDSETDAAKDQKSTALTQANYRFKLEGVETLAGRPAYVLYVEPVVATKYLYRGKIWVDAADFAVEKIEAAPAKNPSFWITGTKIHQIYVKTGEFWLPDQNRSESKIRVGGNAVLTIDYGKYQVNLKSADRGGF